jgi:hypothetical protein
MLSGYRWYGLIGLSVVLAFAGALALNVRYERARRRAEAALTPEERKERAVRANAAKAWIADKADVLYDLRAGRHE